MISRRVLEDNRQIAELSVFLCNVFGHALRKAGVSGLAYSCQLRKTGRFIVFARLVIRRLHFFVFATRSKIQAVP